LAAARTRWIRQGDQQTPEEVLAMGTSNNDFTKFMAWLFWDPESFGSPTEVIAWWECRRLAFNLIVGTYGVVCLLVFFVAITTSGHLQPWEDALSPLALFAAPIVVNVLYTLGWIVALTYRSIEPDVSRHFGPRLLKVGLGLGLLLSTVPAAFWSGYRLLQWAGVAI
jgi:hypothetical protein